MRAMQFRAWHKRYRSMMLVSNLDFYQEGGATLVANESTNEEIVCSFDEIELTRYTQFNDKSERKVFFGDILEDPDTAGYFPRNDRWLVEEDEDDFGVSLSPVGDCNYPWRSDQLKEKIAGMEIIGNIHEHSHLIKKASEQ